MGVAEGVAGTFGIQPLVGAFGVPYQAAEPRDECQIRVPWGRPVWGDPQDGDSSLADRLQASLER